MLAIEDPHARPVDGEGGDAGAGIAGASGEGGADAGEAGHSIMDGGESGASGAAHGGETAGGSGGAEGGRTIAAGMGGAAGHDVAGAAGGGLGGEGGCLAEERRCGGEASSTPEICAGGEGWIVNENENDGEDCPELCVLGECVQCVEPDARCNGLVRQVCEGGTWQSRELCDDYCRRGACESALSCSGGLECEGAVSCCRALEVPGGTFKRDYDGVYFKDETHPATVDGFLLDKFEVTVGRLRKFVEAYDEMTLVAGEGRAAHVVGDTGWNTKDLIPASRAELLAELADAERCPNSTWTDGSTQINEWLPATCVTFPLAYAFCIWDGGRLPTEAEWNYAAAGGSEQREYPWQAPFEEAPPTELHAVYEQLDGLPFAVGGRPAGDGRYGHSDLAGNVLEWTLDSWAREYPSVCVNCVTRSETREHVARGGAYVSPIEGMAVAVRWQVTIDVPSHDIGFRCVRDLD